MGIFGRSKQDQELIDGQERRIAQQSRELDRQRYIISKGHFRNPANGKIGKIGKVPAAVAHAASMAADARAG